MSEGYLCKVSFWNTSETDAWTSLIFQSWTHSSGKVTLLRPFFPCPFASLFRPALGFGSSGPVELVGLHLRSGVFFFFLGERREKENILFSHLLNEREEGRLITRLSGSQLCHHDALTEKAWEDQRPLRDSILLEVLCQNSLSAPLTEKGLLPV